MKKPLHPGDHCWQLQAPTARLTIAVIEPKAETYDEHHQRKRREEGAPRAPFGFARALMEESS